MYFDYELVHYPFYLFANARIRNMNEIKVVGTFYYIMDDGMLLHRLKWEQNQKFFYIYEKYIRYLHM